MINDSSFYADFTQLPKSSLASMHVYEEMLKDKIFARTAKKKFAECSKQVQVSK